MKRSTLSIIIGVVVVALAAGAVVYKLQSNKRAELIAAAIPSRPDLQRFSPALTRLVSSAEDLAQNGPDRVEGLGELSVLYQANGYYPEAIKCYRALAEVDSGNPLWLHRWAILLAGYGESGDAVTLWQRAEKLDGKYLPLRIHLADALLKLNRAAKASGVYNKILERDSVNAYALLGLARIAAANGNWAEAKSLLERSTHGSNLAIGSDLLVTVYDHLGMTPEADALRGQNKAAGAFMDVPDPWLDEIYEECFDPYRLALIGGAADHQNNPELAQKFLERAEGYSPKDGSLAFQLGQHYSALNKYNQAEHYFQLTTQLLPDFSDGWVQWAEVEIQLHNASGSLNVIRDGLQHCPQSAALHLQLAQHLTAIKEFAAAEAQFRESIRLRPEEAEAHMDLAKMFFNLDRVPEGLVEVQAALKAEPDYPPALSTLAFYWTSAGNELQASEALRKIRAQPRILPAERQRLEIAFQQRFGHGL